jgi:hypothetical protein
MMRWALLIGFCLLTAAFAADDSTKALVLGFGGKASDATPKGWTAAQTGKGEGSVWKVVADDTAPSKSGFVLAQTAAGPDRMFNLCVADDTNYKNLEMSVAFKAVRGESDRGGGLVWRYQDADNYYLARMNPLEDNFRVYRVVNGKRTQLGTKDNLKIPSGEWHTITISQTGDIIMCSLDGKKYLDVKDATFLTSGKVGLWTKADAQTYFDEVKIVPK